jgi:hypothetical protein
MPNRSIFCRRNKMDEDLYFRNETKKLIEKYLTGQDPEAENLLLILDNKQRRIPIRGILENIKKYKKQEYTEHEKKIIDELIYNYG